MTEWAAGVVRVWHDDDGWGVVRADGLDGDVFAHFGVISGMPGYRSLTEGEAVEVRWERFAQDGCPYRALEVRRPGTSDDLPEQAGSGSAAYRSSLSITFDEA